MNDWLDQISQDLAQTLDQTLIQPLAQTIAQASKDLETQTEIWVQQALDLTDDLVDRIDRTSTQIEQQVEQPVEQQVEQQLDPFPPSWLEDLDRQLDNWSETLVAQIFQAEAQLQNWFQPLSQTVDPFLNDHPVCVGCRNYHGQSYGGQMLICGLHPYGAQSDTCPDWEGIWPKQP
jgi:hypothetical protein